MKERYERIYALNEALYHEDAPIVIKTGLLLEDTYVDRKTVQLVFKNISNLCIQEVTVQIFPADNDETVIGAPVEYTYSNLTLSRDQEFGKNCMIEISEQNASAFVLIVTRIKTDAEKEWNDPDSQWFPIPLPESMNDSTVIRRLNGLWYCSCGAINRNDENGCHLCGKRLLNWDDEDFLGQNSTSTTMPSHIGSSNLSSAEGSVKKILRTDSSKKPITITIFVSIILVVTGVAAYIWFGYIPRVKYDRAQAALNDGHYNDAYNVFIELENYKDSASMLIETKYEEAYHYMEIGNFQDALDIFTELGTYKDSEEQVVLAKNTIKYNEATSLMNQGAYDDAAALYDELAGFSDSGDMALDCRYNMAMEAFDTRGTSYMNFANAYNSFMALNGYKDSNDRMKEIAFEWERKILNKQMPTGTYQSTITITTEMQEAFYNELTFTVNNSTSNSRTSDMSSRIMVLLTMLPASYKDVSTLKILVPMVYTKQSVTQDQMRTYWSYGFAREYFLAALQINEFLRGTWKTSDGLYYFSLFYEENDGVFQSQHSLPADPIPPETMYYSFTDDQTYIWKDKDSNELAKVYTFTINSFDQVSVYCYGDNRTYTMYRQ